MLMWETRIGDPLSPLQKLQLPFPGRSHSDITRNNSADTGDSSFPARIGCCGGVTGEIKAVD